MKLSQNHFLRFLAILFISATLSGCGSKPEKAADHFMSLLVAGKHLEAQDMLGKDMRSMSFQTEMRIAASGNLKLDSGQFPYSLNTPASRADPR